MKQILSPLVLSLAAASAVAAPTTTPGDLSLNSFEWAAPGGTVAGPLGPVSAGIGALRVSFDDGFGSQPFLAYCVDLYSAAGTFNTAYQYNKIDFSQGDFAASLEPANITALSKLFTFNGGASNTNATTSAGMQLAVWELLYDGAGGSLTTGNFKAGTAPAASIAWANTLLTGSASTVAGYSITLFADEAYSFKPTHQNFITATANFGGGCELTNSCDTPPPVPEPETWAMMAAGLAVVVRLSKRQRK